MMTESIQYNTMVADSVYNNPESESDTSKPLVKGSITS